MFDLPEVISAWNMTFDKIQDGGPKEVGAECFLITANFIFMIL